MCLSYTRSTCCLPLYGSEVAATLAVSVPVLDNVVPRQAFEEALQHTGMLRTLQKGHELRVVLML